MVFQVDFRIDFKCFESGEVLEVYSTVIFEGTRPRQSLLPSIKKSVLYTQKIRYPILLGSGGLEVASLSCKPRVRGSTPPLGTLGNVSENLFLGSTQAL